MDATIDTAELAEALKVSPKTIRKWVSQGRLPALQIAPRARLRFNRDQVEAALRRGTGGRSRQ